MKWDIQTVGFNAKEELIEDVKVRVQKLEKFFDNIIGAEVYLKLIQDEQKNNKTVEIKLNIPGDDVFGGHTSETFEHSLIEAADKVKRQLIKRKELQRA